MSVDQPTGTRARAFGYVCLALAGVSMMVFPSPLYDSLAWLSVTVGSVLLIIPGIIATIGVLARRYRLEWVALPPLVIGLALYAVLAFAGVAFDARPTGLPGAFALASVTAIYASRLFQLQADDRRARMAVAARGEDIA